MEQQIEKFESYFRHLIQISVRGRLYKRLFASQIIYLCARRFGARIVEVGFGTGSGVIGAYPKSVRGLEINQLAVAHCRAMGMQVQAIGADGAYPEADASCDVCVLDNVLEHIEQPLATLDECHRITGAQGGLVIIVPGQRGYDIDDDHKIYYGADELRQLDPRWEMRSLFSLPFGPLNETLSRRMKQYCLVAVYAKRATPAPLPGAAPG